MMYYFKQVKNGVITSVESKSCKSVSPGFIDATEKEYNNFIASLPVVEPTPPRNLADEIEEIKAKIADYDELKARIESLEKK